jgi:molybdate transport system substrate-binding protein
VRAIAAAVALLGALLGLGGCREAPSSGPAAARSGAGQRPALLVAAAADLRPAFTELGRAFTERTGTDVTFAFGSSGQLAQQIANGAPFDLFAAANLGYVDEVVAAGRGDPRSRRTYALGRIVIWSRRTPYADLAHLAADTTARRIAIANPDHAPYGAAAEQALERAGLDAALRPRLVYGENVSDALRLAESGNADAAIVALSLATTSGGRWTLIPRRLHDPLEQALVVTSESDHRARLARRFADLVSSREGRRVLRRYGFLPPGQEAPVAASR